MSDADSVYRPVIVLPTPDAAVFQPRGGGRPKTSKPSRARQAERLDSKFDEIARLLDGSTNASVTDSLPDTDPELVVVFEVVDSTQDITQVLRLVGLEPLIEVQDEIDDDALGMDFARLRPAGSGDESIKLFLHASLANEAAVAQLLRLWKHWKTGKRMITGFGDFTKLFNQLHDVRPWGPMDRIRSTGLADHLAESLEANLAEVPLHIELWFRADPERRLESERSVTSIVRAAGGEVLHRSERPEIGYHALAARLPAATLSVVSTGADLVSLSQVALLQTHDVLFLRPGGQRVMADLDDDLEAAELPDAVSPSGQPLLAVLDGLPASNHPLLRDRLEIVDPDDFSSDPTYTVERRRHGTMVASAVLWGDIGAGELPSGRKVVVRPVLKPDESTINADEAIPWSDLPADLTIRAVRDILGDATTPGAVPSVRVFNVSLGDPLAQFDTIPSAWARAIDWLSYEYNSLFIVSAGNHSNAIPVSADAIKEVSGAARDKLTSEVLAKLSSRRRLLPPAESLNAITVGALHSDASGDDFQLGQRFDLWGTDDHPSPTTAHGRGIRRAIKPDLAAPGGRQLFSPLYRDGGMVSPARGTAHAPGVQVAAPPDKIAFVSGTTFAAAEVARRAVRIIEALGDVEPVVDERYLPVAAKALLVHGTVFPSDVVYAVPTDRLVGHGAVKRDLSAGCLPSQATMLFTGDLAARQTVQLVVPFPHALAALTDLRRVSITLAWFSPINWNHREYRRAKLTIDGPPEMPSGTRTNRGVAYQLTHRGTVQHRIFETDRAFSSEQLTFTVNCADQAGGFIGTVPFAVAISLEVGTSLALDVYELVRTQIREQARIR
jgi:hypothetical protein